MDQPPQEQQLSSDSDNSCKCISDMPDEVLLCILSLLQMKDKVRTSCWSTRWKNLWKSVPNLDFTQANIHRNPELINAVDQILSYHDGSSVREFRIKAQCDLCPLERVEAWIDFLVRHNIEVLYLDFFPHMLVRDDQVVVEPLTPTHLFASNSLTTLALMYCKINLPPNFCLPSLTTLYIKLVNFDPEVLQILLVNCPVLKELTLKNCNGMIDHQIVAENSNLVKLNVDEDGIDGDNDETEFEISAPNLMELYFLGYPKRSKYIGRNLNSLVSVIFDFGYPLDFTGFWKIQNGHFYGSFIEDFCQTQVIKLSSWCTMNLSFREILSIGTSVSHTVKSIIFETAFWKCNLSGLIYVLKNFLNLDRLEIIVAQNFDNESHDFWEEEMDGVKEYWKPDDKSVFGLQHNLRTVMIHGFLGSSDIRADFWTPTNSILDARNTEFVFVMFLLQNLTGLETMTITITEKLRDHQIIRPFHTRPDLTATEYLDVVAAKISEIVDRASSRLFAFPKSSMNARVLIRLL